MKELVINDGSSELRFYRVMLFSPNAHMDRDAQPTSGTIRIQHWGRSDRLRRALRASGICSLFAMIAVFIPLLHFVLVPLLILAAPIVGFVLYGQESAVLGGEGKCPACGADFLVAKSANKFPLNDLCTSCQGSVRIQLGDRITA